MPGVWGVKIGDKILQNGMGVLCPLAQNTNVFVDLKHYDTPNRLARIVAQYAKFGEYAPKLITISGDAYKNSQSLLPAIAVRENINIIITGVLSSWSDDDCLDVYSMTASAWQSHMHGRAFESDAQGITCPAWLLEDQCIAEDIVHVREQGEFHVIATGIRSEGVPAGNHVEPRTAKFALEHGATHVVVGSEVINAPDPLLALRSIAASCEAAKQYSLQSELGFSPTGQVIDKKV